MPSQSSATDRPIREHQSPETKAATATSRKTEPTIGRLPMLCISLAFLVIHCNPRDFPLQDVPLALVVTPLVALGLLWYGSGVAVNAWAAVRVIWLFIAADWVLRYMCSQWYGIPETSPSIVFLVEPMMLVGFGAVVVCACGPRTLVYAFLFAICIGTIWGFLVVYWGGPFEALENLLHQQDLIEEGGILRGFRDDPQLHYRNAGMTSSLFAYSYHVAAALAAVFALLAAKRSTSQKFWLGVVALLLGCGLVSNAERSAILAAIMAAAFAIFFRQRTFSGARLLRFCLVFAIIAAAAFLFDQQLQSGGKDTLISRLSAQDQHQSLRRKDPRLQMALAAVISAFHHPIGNGGMNEYYINSAFDIGHTHSKPGSAGLYATAPHNHFANHIMYLGIPGLFLVALLLVFLYKLVRAAARISERDPWASVLAAGLIAALLNSGAHNAGIFSMEAASCLFLGGLAARIRERDPEPKAAKPEAGNVPGKRRRRSTRRRLTNG